MVNDGSSGHKTAALSVLLVMIFLASSLSQIPMIVGAGNDGPDAPIIAEFPADSNPTPAIDQTSQIESILNNVTEALMQNYIQDLNQTG